MNVHAARTTALGAEAAGVGRVAVRLVRQLRSIGRRGAGGGGVRVRQRARKQRGRYISGCGGRYRFPSLGEGVGSYVQVLRVLATSAMVVTAPSLMLGYCQAVSRRECGTNAEPPLF